MKNLKILCLLALLMAITDYARATTEYVFSKEDTVEIQFGDNSKILIVVESKEDLKKLQQYDINAMLSELNLKVEESGDGKEVLVIKDQQGTKYLKDTTIVYEQSEFTDLESEFEEQFDNMSATGAVSANSETSTEQKEDFWDDQKPAKKNSFRGKRTMHKSILDFGMNNYMKGDGGFPDEDNAPYSVKPWGSWYVALGPTFQTNIKGKFGLEWGATVSWYNFKYQDPTYRIFKGEESVYWEQPDLPGARRSKLTVTYLNAVLVPVLDFGYDRRVKVRENGNKVTYLNHNENKIRVGLGGYVGYRLDSYSKFVWTDGGKRKNHTKSNYFLNNVRYGLRFIVGFSQVDFFVNYDLNPLHNEGRGPDLNAFSFGISF